MISVRAPVGPTNIAKEECCIGRGLAAIRPTSEVSKRFVFYSLRNLESWLSTQGSGSTFTAISKSDLEDIEISLPPLTEQRRIVERLETLLGKVDACQKRLEKIPRILKRFRQAILAAACSGRLTADWKERNDVTEEFEQTTVEAIAEFLGGFAYKSPTFLNKGKIQVIRIGNVRPFTLNLAVSPVFIPDEIANATVRFRLLPDDIALSMTGTKYKQDYGYAGIVEETNNELFLNQRVARLRCGKRLCRFSCCTGFKQTCLELSSLRAKLET